MKKVFFILVALTVGVGAQAGDRKIGNVVAVEREISDIYNTCLKKPTVIPANLSLSFPAV